MPDETKTHRVEFKHDDETITLDVPEGTTLLKAAERAGYELRSGCRKGRCTSCTGRMVSGDIVYDDEPRALTDAQREAGYVSLCIATPDGDCRIQAGDRTLVELFPNLWGHLDVDPPE
jgi:ferredoxin